MSKHTPWIFMLQFTKDRTAVLVSDFLGKSRKIIQKQPNSLLFRSNDNWHFWSMIFFYHYNQFLSANIANLMIHQIHTKPWKTNAQETGKDLAISVSKVDKPVLLILPSPLSPLHTNYFSWTPFSHFRFFPPISFKKTFKTTVLSKLPNPFLSTDSLKKKNKPTCTAFLIPFLAPSNLAVWWT